MQVITNFFAGIGIGAIAFYVWGFIGAAINDVFQRKEVTMLPHQHRVVAEHERVTSEIDQYEGDSQKLAVFMASDKFSGVDHAEQVRLTQQYEVMLELIEKLYYLQAVLKNRIEAFAE